MAVPAQIAMEDEYEDDAGNEAKRARYDDQLEEIAASLAAKYPPGRCPTHADLPCFHHRASDLHFELTRPRLLVWASGIVSPSRTIMSINTDYIVTESRNRLCP